MEDHTDLIEALITQIEDYGNTNIKLVKLQAAQGTTLVLSSLISNTAAVIAGSMFLLVSSVGIALWLGQLLGEVYYGFFIVAGFYGIAGLVCYVYLNKWVRKPISTLVNVQAFNISPDESDLKESMLILENERAVKGKVLKESLHNTFESLKPVNLVRNAIHTIISSPEIKTDVATTATGLAAGYVAKKMVTGKSDNVIRNIAGTLLEVEVIKMVNKHPKEVGTSLRFLQLLLIGKKNRMHKL